MRTVFIASLLVAASTLTACASGLEQGPGEPGIAPDSPGTGGGPSGGSQTPGSTKARLVTPRPGMIDPRPVEWEKVRVGGNGRELMVYFWGGIEPCYVLDRVDVEYREKEVVVTLFEGADPAARDVACIEVAVYKVVKADLTEPLAGRRVVDGAASNDS